MNLVNVKYFALLREKAGVESEELFFEGTYQELYEKLSSQYDFQLPSSMIQVAVNDEFSRMDALVENNSRVVFIPPVAGG